MRRRRLVIARDRRGAQRARRRRGAAAGRMSVVDGIGHRGSNICRATDGYKQHQHGLGTFGGHKLRRLRQALDRIAVEARILMAFLERPHHGLASGPHTMLITAVAFMGLRRRRARCDMMRAAEVP